MSLLNGSLYWLLNKTIQIAEVNLISTTGLLRAHSRELAVVSWRHRLCNGQKSHHQHLTLNAILVHSESDSSYIWLHSVCSCMLPLLNKLRLLLFVSNCRACIWVNTMVSTTTREKTKMDVIIITIQTDTIWNYLSGRMDGPCRKPMTMVYRSMVTVSEELTSQNAQQEAGKNGMALNMHTMDQLLFPPCVHSLIP